MLASFTKLIREFLTLGVLGAIASIVGIGSGVNSLMNSGGQPGAGQGASQTTGALQTISPAMLQAFQQLLQIDPSGYVGAGQRAGGQYADQAQLSQIYQQLMGGQAMQQQQNQSVLRNAGNQVWGQAQDPQNALYARTLQQIQDQSRQASSARGIGMSPESAGLENQATGNFNIDWQNNQLARQLQAMQGLTSAYGASNQAGALMGADLSAGANFGAQVPQNTLQSGAVPFQTQQQGYGAPMQYGNQYSTSLNTAFNPQLANFNMAGTNFNANQQQMGGQSLGQGLTGLNTQMNQPGSWLNGLFGSGSGTTGTQQPYYGGGTASDASAYYTGGGSVL